MKEYEKYSSKTGTRTDLAFLDLAEALGYRMTVDEDGHPWIESQVVCTGLPATQSAHEEEK